MMIDANLKSKGDKVISTFESIENKFPSDIRQSSSIIANDIASQNSKDDSSSAPLMTKEDLRANVEKLISVDKITMELIGVKENDFYLPLDAAHKIYVEMKRNNMPNAWLMANLLLFKWFYMIVFNEPLTGARIERETNEAIKAPIWYLIKGIIFSLLTLVPIVIGIVIGTVIIKVFTRDSNTTSNAMGYFAGRVIMRIAFLLFYIFRLQWRILTSSVDMDKQLMPVTGSQYALQSEIA